MREGQGQAAPLGGEAGLDIGHRRLARHAGAAPPGVSIKEQVVRNQPTIDTCKAVDAQAVACAHQSPAGQRWADARRSEVIVEAGAEPEGDASARFGAQRAEREAERRDEVGRKRPVARPERHAPAPFQIEGENDLVAQLVVPAFGVAGLEQAVEIGLDPFALG